MKEIKYNPEPPDKEELNERFPNPDSYVEFVGGDFVYPMFTNVLKRAKDSLVVGQKYKVTRTEVLSSWCAIWLEGFGEEEGDFFHFSLFKKQYE